MLYSRNVFETLGEFQALCSTCSAWICLCRCRWTCPQRALCVCSVRTSHLSQLRWFRVCLLVLNHQMWSSLELTDAEVAQGFASTSFCSPKKQHLVAKALGLMYKGSVHVKVCPGWKMVRAAVHPWEYNTGAWLAQFWLALGASQVQGLICCS